MGAVFTVAILLGMIAFALMLIAIGIIISITVNVKRKNERPYSKGAAVISKVMLAVGIFILLIPVSFFTIIIYSNNKIPENYVDTGLVIEEEGYQYDSFTVDGVVYESFELDTASRIYFINTTPIFSYKYDSFMNQSRWGNYYKIENSQGFDMVYGELGSLFAPSDQIDSIIEYYNTCDVKYYVIDGETQGIKLVCDELQEFFRRLDYTNFEEVRMEISDFPDTIEVYLTDSDGYIVREKHQYLIIDGYVYLEHTVDYNSNGNLELWGKKLPYAYGKKIIDNLVNENSEGSGANE
ncbi:MAG: hypothetical protein IJ499_02630 [Clostridia bacterium]|nr:hypothetical protein [Clostridia bacterium]